MNRRLPLNEAGLLPIQQRSSVSHVVLRACDVSVGLYLTTRSHRSKPITLTSFTFQLTLKIRSPGRNRQGLCYQTARCLFVHFEFICISSEHLPIFYPFNCIHITRCHVSTTTDKGKVFPFHALTTRMGRSTGSFTRTQPQQRIQVSRQLNFHATLPQGKNR